MANFNLSANLLVMKYLPKTLSLHVDVYSRINNKFLNLRMKLCFHFSDVPDINKLFPKLFIYIFQRIEVSKKWPNSW